MLGLGAQPPTSGAAQPKAPPPQSGIPHVAVMALLPNAHRSTQNLHFDGSQLWGDRVGKSCLSPVAASRTPGQVSTI